MNKILLLFATLTALAACSTVKDSDDYRKLAAEKASLEEQIRARDEEIDEITASMNRWTATCGHFRIRRGDGRH
jgi:hypothetical protein